MDTGKSPVLFSPATLNNGGPTNIVGFDVVQTVNPAHFRGPLRHALKTDMGRPGWIIPDYDFVTTYWLHSLDDLRLMTTDPAWAELEEGALARTNMSVGHFVIGHEVVHFENRPTAGAGAAAGTANV